MSRNSMVMKCMVVLVVLAVALPAVAFVVASPGGSRENTRAGAMATRAPGNMVADGLGRLTDVRPRPLQTIEITETRQTSARNEVIAEGIQDIFDDLNAMIVALNNAMRLRAGFSPMLPATRGFSDTTTGGTSGTDLSDLLNLLDSFSGLLPG